MLVMSPRHLKLFMLKPSHPKTLMPTACFGAALIEMVSLWHRRAQSRAERHVAVVVLRHRGKRCLRRLASEPMASLNGLSQTQAEAGGGPEALQ
jgi:hypothetical protein